MTSPSVAICIPTYNQAQFLVKAVESALQQTYPVQIWVSDDASTDETATLMNELCSRFEQLRYYRHKTNVGMQGNFDFVTRLPETDFIVHLDSDDLLYPSFVQSMVKLLNSYPNAAYGHCAIQEIDIDDKPKRVRRLKRLNCFQTAHTSLKALSIGNPVMVANICMFRREALTQVNYYENCPEYTTDWTQAIHIAAAGWGNAYTPAILGAYRTWTDSAMTRPARKSIELEGLVYTYDKILIPTFERHGWSKEILLRNRRKLAMRHAIALDSRACTEAQKEGIRQLIARLGNSPSLQLYILLIDMGMGPYFRLVSELRLRCTDFAKLLLSKTTVINDIEK